MPRRVVKLCEGQYYHFYNRGHNREPIFFERENYSFFLRRIRRHLLPVLEIVAYCLMPTHYHLLVLLTRTADDPVGSRVSPVSRAMMRFAVSFTKAMNKRYGRAGAFFQGSFQAKHVAEDSYLLHLSRYIHLNPVLAGLVDCPEGWEFSSYPEYIGVRRGTLPRPEIILGQFSSVRAYRDFVESYMPDERKVIAHLLFDC